MKNAIFALLFLAYPILVYFGLHYVKPSVLAALFALLFIFRHFSQTKYQGKIPHLNLLLFTVLTLLAYSTIANSELALKFYPVVVSLSFLTIFAYSLVKPPTVVQIIASRQEQLDENGVIYTRKVTQVWCVYFIMNALIATWTIYHEDQTLWLMYNGLISYILMALLMAIEFLIRKRIKRRNASKT